MEKELKKIIFDLGNSHSKLAQEMYDMLPSYNNAHYSYKASENFIEYLRLNNLLDEFLTYMDTHIPCRRLLNQSNVPPCHSCRNYFGECQISAGQKARCLEKKWIHYRVKE